VEASFIVEAMNEHAKRLKERSENKDFNGSRTNPRMTCSSPSFVDQICLFKAEVSSLVVSSFQFERTLFWNVLQARGHEGVGTKKEIREEGAKKIWAIQTSNDERRGFQFRADPHQR